ncbi:serine/threonine-protein kinase pim-3-like [Boleophthalmus pectinirostris]|uniref:serine/threonine-protein kinase pim-3-like n=1 Tax=Boleophthalmus pectinirostris TaxID=150288 RepID=UPI00242CA581|nr:serine/threonine-protein kinase pim-3-like [Boleophthalmus pectinirostris]
MTKAAPNCHSVGKDPSVNLLDWYLQDQEVVLVMERPTPSEDLFNYCLKNAPLSEDQAKVLMRQVVDALVDLHAKEVFHRDIKMENLLVQTTESGSRIRIIDFGCGCNVQSNPYYDYNGTEEFAPPEAFKNKGYHAGPTSVWQIGALLYELLRSDEKEEFTTKRWTKRKLSLSGVSQECCHFLQACLAVNPTHRISLDQLSHHPWFSVV